jgi:elongation factor G
MVAELHYARDRERCVMSESKSHSDFIISVAISPKMNGDLEKLERALRNLVDEDPSIQIKTSGVQTVLSGMSELHLEAICDRILHESKIQLDISEPKVIYLETIRKSAEGEGKYIRQTGGSGSYGHCRIRLTPNEAGEGYEFVNEIKDGVIPEKFIDPIEQGVQGALELGVLSGYPIINVTATLYDGSYHDTDSNEMAFKFAGSIAAKEAARKAGPVLLEPVMALEVRVPEEHMGIIIRDINARRGRIEGLENASGSQVIKASVPLAEMFGYGRDVRSMMHGRADYSMRFAKYEEAHRPEGPGRDGAAVTANKPNRPKAGIGPAAVRLDAEPE